MQLAATLLVATAEALAQGKQAHQVSQAKLMARGRGSSGGAETRRIVISIPDRKLALVEDGRVVKVYSVAVGATASPSPSGELKIVHRIPEPTYYAPGRIIPPGKENPLGTRWLGLSQKGYGIHGTNQPGSIGRRSSHGCIRMRNRDIEELFERVRAGDAVELHAEHSLELAQIFGTPAQPAPALAEAATAVASASGPQANHGGTR